MSVSGGRVRVTRPFPAWVAMLDQPLALLWPLLGVQGGPGAKKAEEKRMEYGKCTYLLREKSITSTVQLSMTTPCYGNGPRFFGARSRISRKEDAPNDLPTTDRPTYPPLDRPGISDHGLNKMRTWKNKCLDKAKL